MNLNDFFEGNSVSMEVIQYYDEYRLSMGRKTALNAVRSELRKEFAYEDEQKVIFLMTLYWCGIQNGFIDEKSRNQLEKFTEENILNIYDRKDGGFIYQMLRQLLEAQPVKIQKECKSSNPGAYNWKSGDIYAYLMDENDAKNMTDKSFVGKYILIYCIENKIKSKKSSEVTCYFLLKNNSELVYSLDDILDSSRFLPHLRGSKNFLYRYVLISSNAEYPSPEKFIFLGNFLPIVSPPDEQVPPAIYNRMVVWKWFGEYIEKALKNLK